MLFFVFFQSNNNDTNNGNANAGAQISAIGAILAAILILFFLCLLLFCFAYACGKYVSKFISILALMISNAWICYVSLSSGYQAKFIIITSLSWFTAICNFLGMVLPCCCMKLSHLYDNPDINKN